MDPQRRVTIPVAWAVPIAFVMLIPAVIGILWVERQAEANARNIKAIAALAEENRQRDILIAQLRRDASAAARKTDLRLCEAINLVTRRDRATVQESLRQSKKVLITLGFTAEQAAEYTIIARKSAQRELARRPLIGGGDCTSLPNPAAPLDG